jgi:hypothetical protein
MLVVACPGMQDYSILTFGFVVQGKYGAGVGIDGVIVDSLALCHGGIEGVFRAVSHQSEKMVRVISKRTRYPRERGFYFVEMRLGGREYCSCRKLIKVSTRTKRL